MAEEKIVEEHKHVITDTGQGISESHSDEVVERNKEEGTSKVTIEKKTTIKHND